MTRSVGPRNKRRLTFWSRGRSREPSTHDRLHEPPHHSLYFAKQGSKQVFAGHPRPHSFVAHSVQHPTQCLKLSSLCLGVSQLLHSVHPRQERTKQALDMGAAWWKLASSLCALCPGVDNNRQNCVNIHSLNMCDKRTQCIVQQKCADNPKHILHLVYHSELNASVRTCSLLSRMQQTLPPSESE